MFITSLLSQDDSFLEWQDLVDALPALVQRLIHYQGIRISSV
jgi:hypothetical protein